VRDPQRVHGDGHLAFQVPGAGRFDLALEFCLRLAELLVVGVGIGPRGQYLVVTVDERLGLGDSIHDVAQHVLGRVEHRLLLEQSDGVSGKRRASPEVGSSRPAMMRSKVDLPAPLCPSTPILTP
jgi:hypothetical protein